MRRKSFIVVLVALFSIAMMLCQGIKKHLEDIEILANEKRNGLLAWQTPGYVQGDFGNVPRLGPDGKGIMTPELHNSRIFPDTRINGMTKQVKNIFYYEVNDTNLLNAKTLTIGDTGIPFVDVVIIFAANINWDMAKERPYLHLNYQVNSTIMNYEKYIKPLQDMGIKVVLDILPNHDGVGFLNLRPEDIEAFTDQLVELADRFNLDGFDFDEEYAGYGKPGRPPKRANSMTDLLIRLREKLPNKIISVFNYGLPIDMTNRGPELVAKDVVDFASANYGGGSAAAPAYLAGNERYASQSVELNWGSSASTERDYATRAIEGHYGFRMYFNPHNNVTNPGAYRNYQEWYSEATQVYYGENVVWDRIFYPKDYASNINE